MGVSPTAGHTRPKKDRVLGFNTKNLRDKRKNRPTKVLQNAQLVCMEGHSEQSEKVASGRGT